MKRDRVDEAVEKFRSELHCRDNDPNFIAYQRLLLNPSQQPVLKIRDIITSGGSTTQGFSNSNLVAGSPYVFTGAENAFHVNAVPRNNTETGRIGRRYTNKTLRFRAVVEAQSTTLWSPAAMCVIYVKHPNQASALPSFTSVWTSMPSTTAYSNITNMERYEILACKRMSFAPKVVLSPSAEVQQNMELVVDLGDRPTIYTLASTNGQYNEIVTGAIVVYMLGIWAFADSPLMVECSCQLEFTE